MPALICPRLLIPTILFIGFLFPAFSEDEKRMTIDEVLEKLLEEDGGSGEPSEAAGGSLERTTIADLDRSLNPELFDGSNPITIAAPGDGRLRLFGGGQRGGVSFFQESSSLSSYLRPLDSNRPGVRNWGRSQNPEFRNQDPDNIPQNRTYFDSDRGRATIDPRSPFEIEYEEQNRIPYGERLENLLDRYQRSSVGGGSSASSSLEETGGFAGIAYGESFNVEPLNHLFGTFYTLVGYEVVTAPDNFFYSNAFSSFPQRGFDQRGVVTQVYVEGFASIGTIPDFNTGWNTTHSSEVRTRYTNDAIRSGSRRDPGVLFSNQYREETRSQLDLNTYQFGATVGIEQICLPCGVSCGLFFPFGVQINDWDLSEERHLTQNGSRLLRREASSSGTDAEFFLNIEARVGVPLGPTRVEAFLGTQLAGGETTARAGGTRATISSGSGENLYGGISVGIPIGNVSFP